MSEPIKICGGCAEYDYECRCAQTDSGKFKRLFEDARKSQTYWLETLDLKFNERLIRYQRRYERTTNVEKRKNLGSKIRSLKECIQDVRQSVKTFESLCQPPKP